MQGEYTIESCTEFSRKLATVIRANYTLQELKEWLDCFLDNVDPCDWPNAKYIREKIKELEG